MYKYTKLELCLNACIMLVMTTIFCTFGILFIIESNVKHDEVPCELLNIVDFSCYKPSTYIESVSWSESSMNRYYSSTSMLLRIHNTNVRNPLGFTTFKPSSFDVNITMIDNCDSCFDCKNLYNIGTTYNCALYGDKYKISDGNYTTNYGVLIVGIAFLMISTIFIMGLIMTLITLRLRIRKRFNHSD